MEKQPKTTEEKNNIVSEEETQKLEVIEETDEKQNDTEETREETIEIEDSSPTEEELKQQEAKAKQLKKNYLKIFIELVLSSLIYLIASSCDKFEGINQAVDVQNLVVLNYAKYIMIFTYILTIFAILIFILKLCKKDLPKIKLNYEVLYNVLDWVLLLPVCIALATFCFSFVFTFTTVSGDSMNPNIEEGDRLLVTYPSDYDRFDVVVVKVDDSYHEVYNDDLYLKRIIGKPGDYLDYKYEKGITQLYINGEKVVEAFYTEAELKEYLTYNRAGTYVPFEWYERCFTGSDIRRVRCELKDGNLIIPEGYYFVLGDNRPGSKDSRNIGLVKEEDIIGVAKYIVNNIFSPEKII